MRTPLLAGLLAILLPACMAGEISGVGDDDQGSGSDMGSGGGGGGGDGSGSDVQDTPRVDLSVDKTTVTSDLNVETTITITATSAMGFTGDVTLAVSAEDASAAAITDWTTTLESTTLTLGVDETKTTTVKLSAMGDTAALAGTLKVTATSSAAAADASVDVTFNPVLVVTFNDDGNGQCVYPVNHAVNNPWRLSAGRKIRVVNGSPNLGLQVHTNNSIAGFPHENVVTPPGEGYEKTVTTVGDIDEFYCHKGDGTMVEGGGSVRNYLRVVQ